MREEENTILLPLGFLLEPADFAMTSKNAIEFRKYPLLKTITRGRDTVVPVFFDQINASEFAVRNYPNKVVHTLWITSLSTIANLLRTALPKGCHLIALNPSVRSGNMRVMLISEMLQNLDSGGA